MGHVIRHEGGDEVVAVVVTLQEGSKVRGQAKGLSLDAGRPPPLTDLVEPEDHWDVLLGADGDQVVGQQLAGRQELVVPSLVDEDVQLRTRVRRRQRGGVVGLGDAGTGASVLVHTSTPQKNKHLPAPPAEEP